MKIFNTNKRDFAKFINNITKRDESDRTGIEDIVKTIIHDVKRDGDNAVIKYTNKFDGTAVRFGYKLNISTRDVKNAVQNIPIKDLKTLRLAAKRIKAFHKRQSRNSWSFTENDTAFLGQMARPIEKVGIYVPGGKASYPSTVLMNAVPAKIAGVKEIVMVTPPGKNGMNPYILAAADLAGVDKIYQVGGAQAVAALAYGTQTIPKVDKIVGPGNIYVATAKRLVFGTVDIDMIAGPSEILIINDGTGEPSWIAADLLSQAEHDELASSILLTTSKDMAYAVAKEIDIQLAVLERRDIAKRSTSDYGAIIITKDIDEAVDISNAIAPEHLELFVKKPFALMKKIKNAGAVFLGYYTPEAMGDYIAGPNHTLPTGGTARFSSPLGVDDFMKFSSIISFSKKGLENLGKDVIRFAGLEGLEAHGMSVKRRLNKN